MSQQEFVNPEHQYTAAQQAETADYQWREKPIGKASIGEPYDGSYAQSLIGEKLDPRQTRQPRLWTPVVFFALVLFMSGTIFGFALATFSSSHILSFPQVRHQVKSAIAPGNVIPSQSFPVSGPVHLSIHDLASGTIRVHTGNADHVLVNATTQTDATIAIPAIRTTQQDDTIAISVDNHNADGVILDIATPRTTSLDIETDTATIQFAGEINPYGTYQFASQTGSINLTIPANSAFYLSNIVDVGDFTNEFGSDVAGSSPRATLAILAYQGGSVTIQKS